MKFKGLLLIALAGVLGAWMLWAAITDYQNSKALAAEGKTATAQVLDRSVGFRSRGGKRYYLSVQFQTETGQAMQRRVEVQPEEYQEAVTGSTVTLRYLSSNPAVCAVGEPVPKWRSKLTSALVLVVSGAVLVVTRFKTRQVAGKVAEHVSVLCESRFDYAPANANEFAHLDLGWYDTSQRWLEEHGFVLLGDEENLTFQRTSKGNRTMLRTLLRRDGTWLAYLYHFKPSTPARALAGGGFRILELQTYFTNGFFVTTSNAEAAGKLDSPPSVDALRLPAKTSLEAIMDAHVQRVAAFLGNNPGVTAKCIENLDEIHRIQNVLQQIKAEFRRNHGLSRAELQRLAGNRLDSEQLEVLHADVEQLHAERIRKAA